MEPNNIRPSPIFTIIPRFNIILVIRLKSPYQSNPFITIRPIYLHCIPNFVSFAAEARARVFDDVGFVAGSRTGDGLVVYDAVGPFPF